MLRTKINPLIAVATIVFATAAIAIPESRLVETSTATPRRVWDSKSCTACHRDVETIKKMQDKSGNPAYCAAELNEAAKAGRFKHVPRKTY